MITPSNSDITCTAGKQCRLLDFGVVAERFERQITSMEAVVAPWKPHLTLVVKVKALAGQVLVRKLVTPGALRRTGSPRLT